LFLKAPAIAAAKGGGGQDVRSALRRSAASFSKESKQETVSTRKVELCLLHTAYHVNDRKQQVLNSL
jgi:hypothetical protein